MEGPISFDLAKDKNAAEIKKYESSVAGDADILLVPDIMQVMQRVRHYMD